VTDTPELEATTTASRSRLSVLHGLVCEHLIRVLMSGNAETKDIAAASKFLKDNGIEAAFETDDKALEDVEDALEDYARDNNIVPIKA